MSTNNLDTKGRFKRIQQYIDRMPSLSTTVTKVLEICNQPNTSPNDLNKVISIDPVLTGQVLRLINSAYYSLPNKVNSLARAIIILGLNTVKNLAISTAILGALGKNTSRSLNMDHFWDHSICVGVTAKALASYKTIPTTMQEEYFIAGLLHDLGKIPLSDCFSEEYEKALQLTVNKKCDLQRAELMIFGINHCDTGKMIAEKWKLTDSILNTLAHHHNPINVEDAFQDVVSLVSVGNLYAYYYNTGSTGDTEQESLNFNQSLSLSGLLWDEVIGLDTKIRQEIEKAHIFLKVGKGYDQ